MRLLTTLIRQHPLAAAAVAALAPLLALVALQFSWLARLERTSALALEGVRLGFLEAVVAEVQFVHRSAAEQLLNVPPSFFVEGRLQQVEREWAGRALEGVRTLFLVDFSREAFGTFLAFDPRRRTLERMAASDEALAIVMASAPWQVPGMEQPARARGIRVDERTPPFRIVLNPVASDSGRIVGVAGMVLDQERFATELLPRTIARLLSAHFAHGPGEGVVVTVRDDKGGAIFSTAPASGAPDQNARRFSFVYTDWTIGLRSPAVAPRSWAHASFLFNASILALLTAALIGGMTLALAAAHRAMKLSQMKSDFVSNVSHELRTPLAAIRVFAELLRLGRAATPDKVREYGAQIETESRRLTRLIDNILDFSQIESGRKTYQIAPGDVREVAAAAVAAFRERLQGGAFSVLYEPPPSPFPQALLDPDAIGQAVHNLLDNAVKYAQAGGQVRVRVWAESDHVALAVEDDGPGIPLAEQRRIFERFHRAGGGLVHDVKGTGLGLAIVRHIMQAHRGAVGVKSAPGRGSTFVLRLPRVGPRS